ncbi:MAG: SAF domain-containing protein [Georgenia sp.]
MRAPTPPSRSRQVRARRLLWRRRHLIAALCLGLAAFLTLTAVRPPAPRGEPVLTLASDLPVGSVLTAADVRLRTMPAEAAHPDALRDPAEAVGLPLAVAMPAGAALLPTMLAGPGLAAGTPPGTVVVPVPVADPASARLARPGLRVTFVATTTDGSGSPGGAEVVARGVVVLAVEDAAAEASFLGSGTAVTFVYVAASEAVATVLLGSSAWAPLRAVLEGP